MKRPFIHKVKEGYWHIYYYDETGKRHSFSTGETLSGPAGDKFDEFKKNQFKPVQKNKTLLSEFLINYLSVSESNKTPKTCLSIKTSFNEFIRICGDKPLFQYTVFMIDKFLSQKSKEASVWTARKYRIHLNAAFNKAVEWNIINENPFNKSIRIKKPASEIKYFEKHQFRKFIKCVDDPLLKDIYIFAVLSGLRLNEILRLKVSDINYRNKIIFVDSTHNNPTKDKEPRNVELNPNLIQILRKYTSRSDNGLLFQPKQGIRDFYDYIERKFKKYIDKCGLDKSLHFHCLRATFGMWMLAENINLKFISQQLGHSRISTTEDYYSRYITTKNKGLNKISF